MIDEQLNYENRGHCKIISIGKVGHYPSSLSLLTRRFQEFGATFIDGKPDHIPFIQVLELIGNANLGYEGNSSHQGKTHRQLPSSMK